MFQQLGVLSANKIEETANSSKPRITGPRAVVSAFFQVIEEIQHTGLIQILNIQRVWRRLHAVSSKAHQELDGVAVREDCVSGHSLDSREV
jgi:hypothetical protein